MYKLPPYNKGMASVSEMAAQNTAQYQSDFNKRGTQMVREFCTEHSASSRGGTAELCLGYDTDLSLCVEWKFKLVISGPTGLNYPPIMEGSNTYGSYNLWIEAFPVGSAINTDGAYGCQCWDYASAFWLAQVNRNFSTGGTGGAYGAWTIARTQNAGTEFELITSWSQIKKGDWIVWDRGRFTGDDYGHVAMAAENANGSNPILCYGQNQGGTPTAGGGSTLNLASQTSYKFLGAFRYKAWK